MGGFGQKSTTPKYLAVSRVCFRAVSWHPMVAPDSPGYKESIRAILAFLRPCSLELRGRNTKNQENGDFLWCFGTFLAEEPVLEAQVTMQFSGALPFKSNLFYPFVDFGGRWGLAHTRFCRGFMKGIFPVFGVPPPKNPKFRKSLGPPRILFPCGARVD